MASMPELFINVATVDGVKLSLARGDTLAVMVRLPITSEQRAHFTAALESKLPRGVKVIIFDGGTTIAAISNSQRSGAL